MTPHSRMLIPAENRESVLANKMIIHDEFSQGIVPSPTVSMYSRYQTMEGVTVIIVSQSQFTFFVYLVFWIVYLNWRWSVKKLSLINYFSLQRSYMSLDYWPHAKVCSGACDQTVTVNLVIQPKTTLHDNSLQPVWGRWLINSGSALLFLANIIHYIFVCITTYINIILLVNELGDYVDSV